MYSILSFVTLYYVIVVIVIHAASFEADKNSNELDLKDEEDYRAEITPDCDWIIGAFAKRAEARGSDCGASFRCFDITGVVRLNKHAELTYCHITMYALKCNVRAQPDTIS